MTVRVRIAPSPTGHLHVGNARAALFNWLFARRHGGVFILRIDDTDRERSAPEYEEDILASLRWLGLDWDEGVEVGGPHGPYRQSSRFDRYREVAQALVAQGDAYYDDRPAEVLERLREKAQADRRHPGHYIRRPQHEAKSGVIRMSVPQEEPVFFVDLVRGEVRFEPEDVDDFVLLRSDGTPTYHLASTVDDVDYSISHVARGEDLLPSTPKHILIARALGAPQPIYAHLPLLFGPDGKKLSKRHGETALSYYRDSGYLADAVFNYLALLGWSLDGETTIFSRDQATAAFDLGQVSRNPAVFDPDKLLWLNGEYIRALDPARFAELARPHLEQTLGRALDAGEWGRFLEMAPLVQERTRLLPEAASQVLFLYVAPEYDQESWDKVMTVPGVAETLASARERLERLTGWTPPEIEGTLRQMLEDLGIGARKGLQPLRVAVTGSSVSPPLFESMAALGREHTLGRLRRAEELLA